MSTKTPEENESDMEAGMTTAERRRRRRRGGGLRVPSDNVPRRISSPAVAEDPSVAIAMAYTGGNGSEAPALAADPIAPEPISTLIDPPAEEVIEEISFESKTREMSAVDLEELGLDGESPLQARTVSTEIPITYSTVVVDEEMYTEQTPSLAATSPGAPPSIAPPAIAPPAIAPPSSASITGQMGALIGGSPAAAMPPATPPPIPAAAHHTPHAPPPSPRVALTPAASSPAISLPPPAASASFAAPQAPSAFGTSPGHPPPPASGFAASSPQPPPPAVAPFTPLAASAAPAQPAPFTISSSNMASAGVVAVAPQGSPPAAPPPSPTSSPPSSVTSSATGIPIAIAPSPSAPVSISIAPPATSVPVAAAPAVADGHNPPAAAVEEAPPPPRPAKGRAQTLALSEDDLEEFLEENRLDLRGDRADRQQSSSDEIGELDVEMEVDSAAVVSSSVEERAVDRPSDRAIEAAGASDRAAERPSDRQIPATSDRPADRSGEIGLESGERRERVLTPHGVPTVQVAELGRTKSASVPPPMPAAPLAATTSPGAAAAPVGPAGSPALSSPSLVPPAAATAPARSTAPPPPTPTKPPPAPPKKAPDKRAAAVAAASTGGDDKKPRSKAWFADVFDEDYLRTLPFLTPQATQAEAELVAASLGVSPGAKLLDVGCGYGRHAMELAARGYHVVGLDLSTPLLVRGGEEAHRRGLTINFIRGDMRELDFDGQFDGAYCLFSTFGYFDDETNKKTAGNIARALRPGGKCVFEILNRDYVIADLPTRVWWEGDGCVVLEEVDFNYFSSRICVNRSVVFDDGRQLEQEISIRAYSLHEVGKLMLAAGFRVLEVSGSYQTRGRFFGNQSRHIIVVAERTG